MPHHATVSKPLDCMAFSYSQLKAYRTCPRQYEYAFVKKLKTPLTREGSFGVSLHTCLQKWGKREMAARDTRDQRSVNSRQLRLFTEGNGDDKGSADSGDLSLEGLASLWHQSFLRDGYDRVLEAEYDLARGEEILSAFYEWWRKEERKVVIVEKGFRIGVADGEVMLTGRFDRIEEMGDGTLRIIDFKSGAVRNQQECGNDLQLSVYALAARETFGREVGELVLLFLGEEFTEVRTARTAAQLQDACKAVSSLAGRIDSRDYTPTPSRRVCAGCPYRTICDVAAV